MLNEKLYSAKEAADLLSLTDGRIRQICRWNKIGTKVGRDWLLNKADLKKLRDVENRKKKSA